MGLLETRLATLSDCVEASQRPFAWAPFPARAAKPEPLEPEWGTCAWPPSRIDAYSSLIPATRRESSRTYRKYEVPNHVVTQNDWQPPRRVENPRPKSGRSPVRSRPWPLSILAVQRPYSIDSGAFVKPHSEVIGQKSGQTLGSLRRAVVERVERRHHDIEFVVVKVGEW
jgi:hypothetical protein